MEPKIDEGKKERTGKERTMHERARISMEKRKVQLRTRLIFGNSFLALLIIIIVLICKVIDINSAKSSGTIEEGKIKKETQLEESKKEDSKKKATASPVSKDNAEGANKWIRKDLDTTKPMVALTFDDGPYGPVSRRLLTALDKNDAKATFFYVGNRVLANRSLIQDAYKMGNQIASHTYRHADLSKLKKKKIKEQVDKTNAAIEKVIGCKTTALRPPYGRVNKAMREAVKAPMIYWNVDSEDWKYKKLSSKKRIKKILKGLDSLKDGDVVLMHELYPTTAAAVEKLLPKMKKRGIQFVTIDELFYYKGITLSPGKVYYSAR